jgi:hypothetical protein
MAATSVGSRIRSASGGRCFVDVFSCQSFDPWIAASVAVEHFGGTSTLTVLSR